MSMLKSYFKYWLQTSFDNHMTSACDTQIYQKFLWELKANFLNETVFNQLWASIGN